MTKPYNLFDWATAQQVAYELTQDQLDEIQALLGPAIAKCEELNIPFSFLYQGALEADGISVSLNGSAGVADETRISPNMLLFHMLFNARNEIQPDEALAWISQAVNDKLSKQQDEGPQILVP